MLKEDKIQNFSTLLLELLKIINICALIGLFCTKYYVYKTKENINSIEKQVISLQNEQNNLLLELNYLTNPARLKNIYNLLEQDNKLHMQQTLIGQEITIEEFKDLLQEKRK